MRAKKKWPTEWEQKIQRREGNTKSHRKRADILKSALKSSGRDIFQAALGAAQEGPMSTLPVDNSEGYGEQNLNWALRTLADPGIKAILKSHTGESKEQTVGAHAHGPELLAQDILLASRRKQGIILRRIIHFQPEIRNWFKKREQLQNFVTDEDNISKIVYMQSVFRTVLAVMRLRRKRKAALLLQNQWRTNIARREFMNKIRLTILLQACYRGQKARFYFCLVRDEILKMQAVMRRFLVMKHFQTLLERQCLSYKNQIFLLWKRAFTPLSYRSQMWPLFRDSFLGHRILSDEVQRMRKLLGVERTISENLFSDDKVICDIDGSAFEIIDTRKNSFRKSFISFPGESSERVCQSAKRLKTEKLQVYERLDSLKKSPNIENVYEPFGIFQNEKKKKARLLEQLWDSLELADASANFMWMLFPELVEGGDITPVKPGKKGRNRFHEQKQTILNPLEKDLWVDLKMDQLYRKNMSEVALASLKKMPDLHLKLHHAKLRQMSSWKGEKIEVMIKILGPERWREQKLLNMQRLIQGYN